MCDYHDLERKAMGDYHDLYLKKYIFLADNFENAIDMCLKYYGLDPCLYRRSPGFCRMPCLK